MVAMHESWVWWHSVVTILGGTVAQRLMTDLARTMPPLPANAGYFQKWGYAFLQAWTGHDISTNTKGTP